MGDTTYSKGDITYSIEKSKFERVISPIQIGDITYSNRWYHQFKSWVGDAAPRSCDGYVLLVHAMDPEMAPCLKVTNNTMIFTYLFDLLYT